MPKIYAKKSVEKILDYDFDALMIRLYVDVFIVFQ